MLGLERLDGTCFNRYERGVAIAIHGGFLAIFLFAIYESLAYPPTAGGGDSIVVSGTALLLFFALPTLVGAHIVTLGVSAFYDLYTTSTSRGGERNRYRLGVAATAIGSLAALTTLYIGPISDHICYNCTLTHSHVSTISVLLGMLFYGTILDVAVDGRLGRGGLNVGEVLVDRLR